MKEINISTDLEDEDGRSFGMHCKANVALYFIAGRLTLKILYMLYLSY